MELSEFIKDIVLQIIEGVRIAQENTKETDVLINPDESDVLKPNLQTNYRYCSVDFEVALTDMERAGGKSGIGVWFGGIGAGAQGASDKQKISATNIRFSIPIVLPRVWKETGGNKKVTRSKKSSDFWKK